MTMLVLFKDACCTYMSMCCAAAAGVAVAYSRGMDVVGEIHYDWPLESTLEVRQYGVWVRYCW